MDKASKFSLVVFAPVLAAFLLPALFLLPAGILMALLAIFDPTESFSWHPCLFLVDHRPGCSCLHSFLGWQRAAFSPPSRVVSQICLDRYLGGFLNRIVPCLLVWHDGYIQHRRIR